MELIYFSIICFLSSLLKCVTGFGFAIISMPLLTLLFPIKTVSAVVALASFLLCSQIAYKMRTHINFGVVIIPTIVALIGRTIGINLLMTINENILRSILGMILILVTIYFIFFNEKLKVKSNNINGIIFGMCSGVLGGMFNTGGPPIVIYYLLAIPDKYSYIASIQFTFAVGNLYSVFLHILYGNFDASTISLSVASLLAVTLGSFIGCRIVDKIKNINYIIYISMVLMGIFLIAGNIIH